MRAWICYLERLFTSSLSEKEAFHIDTFVPLPYLKKEHSKNKSIEKEAVFPFP